jgi:hypothetical protein
MHRSSPPTPLDAWLDRARRDADRRGLPGLEPLLEALARAAAVLRAADWNPDLAGPGGGAAADER